MEDLRVFTAVCRSRSLTAVAVELGCTQSAVSQHVRRLEREGGVPLLERGVRGVQPTTAGLILAAGAGDGLARINEALRRIADMAAGNPGALRLATGGTTVRRFMAGALSELRARHPQARVEIRSDSSSPRCIDAVRQDRADLAFVTIRDRVAGVEQRPVIDASWVLLAPTASAVPTGRIEVTELPAAGYVALSASSTSHALLTAALERLGAQVTADATVEDWDSAVLLVELGLGWTIVPATHLPPSSTAGGLRVAEIAGLPPVSFGWAARRFSSLSPLTVEFAARVEAGLGPLARSGPMEGAASPSPPTAALAALAPPTRPLAQRR